MENKEIKTSYIGHQIHSLGYGKEEIYNLLYRATFVVEVSAYGSVRLQTMGRADYTK